MKSIILFYQHIGREMYAIRKLEDNLKRKNYEVYVFSIDFEILSAIKVAKSKKIDVIVTPWMYHTLNYEEFVPFIKLNSKVKIVNLHQEQISSKMSESALLPMDGVASDCVYHIVWGEYFKKKLINKGIDEKLIFISGNMRNDEMFEVKISRNEMAESFNLNKDKKWILYAENRDFVFTWSDKMKYEFVCKGADPCEVDEYYRLSKESLQKTMDDLRALTDDFFDKFELIYRPHPGCLNETIDSRCRVISKHSVYEWLRVVDVCVVWNSTTAFESDAMGVPVLLNEPIPNNPRLQADGLNAYPSIKSLKELETIDLKEILQEEKKQMKYKEYYGEVDGNATERLTDIIEKIMLSNDSYEAKLIPTKFSWKNYLYHFVLRLFIRLKIFDIVKFPKSAYAHKNDIPFYRTDLG